MKLKSKEYPASHLMNPKRPYVDADHTDLKATFERIRAEQAVAAKKPTSVIRFKGK